MTTGGVSCAGASIVFSDNGPGSPVYWISTDDVSGFVVVPSTTYYVSYDYSGTGSLTVQVGTTNAPGGTFTTTGSGSVVNQPIIANSDSGSPSFVGFSATGDSPDIFSSTDYPSFVGTVSNICISDAPFGCGGSPPPPPPPFGGGFGFISSSTNNSAAVVLGALTSTDTGSVLGLTLLAISLPLAFFIIERIMEWFNPERKKWRLAREEVRRKRRGRVS